MHGYNADSKRGDDTFIAFNKIPEEMIVYIGGTNESGSASFWNKATAIPLALDGGLR